MLGDDAQPAESDGSRNRATSGPRHAAPRKPLLTKLHIPAGKAVALAAMPTAVLMGMGFTPHLAQADEMPKNPYKPGPCVTQSDTPSPSASKSADSKAKGDDKSTDKSDGTTDQPSGTQSPKPTTSPSPTASPDAPAPTQSAKAPTSENKSAGTAAPTSKPSATPSPTKSVNPWDPLGLGDLVNGLLGGGKTPTPAPTTQAPKPDPTTAKPTPSASPSASAPAKSDDPVSTVGKTVKDTVEGVTSGAGKAAKDTADAVGSAKDKATSSPSPSAGTGKSGSDDPQSYPCPTYDAKALADADVEQGIPLLPDTPWVLKTTKLTLHGLAYDGIVKVKTHNGTVKDVLKFTVTGIDIDNLHQIVDGPKGTKTNVEAAKGSTSRFTGGTVTLYTESLSGNLLGLIPITFTPKAPPPLTLPELFFTNATVIQAAQFGGNLHVPGMHIYGSAS